MELPGVELDAFMSFLYYLYTDYCGSMEGGQATELLVLANQYGLNRLKALCESYISEFISGAPMADIEFSVIGKMCTFILYKMKIWCGVCLDSLVNRENPPN